MRGIIIFLTFFFVNEVLAAQEQDVPDKALCVVCALRGETEAEKVKAHAEYRGKLFYFCSKNCKAEFASDPGAYLPPVLPRPAPAFVLETLDGGSASLKDFENKVVLLDFWATWCKPCLEYMPKLQELYNAHSDQGFVVAGISIDEGKDRVEKIKKFMGKAGISYPVFSDAKSTPAWYTYKVKAIPALFLIDRSGQVVAQWTGTVDEGLIKSEVVSRVLALPEAKN